MLGSVVNPLSASLAAPGIRKSSLPTDFRTTDRRWEAFPLPQQLFLTLTASPKYILISVVSPAADGNREGCRCGFKERA